MMSHEQPGRAERIMFSPFGSGKGGRSGHSARQSLDRALEQASAPPAQQQVAELHRELELTTLMLSEAEEDAHTHLFCVCTPGVLLPFTRRNGSAAG